jgi:hypothetical protein
MGIRENHAPRGQLVHVRREDLALRIQARHVPIPHIVGDEVYDVRKSLFGGLARRESSQRQR